MTKTIQNQKSFKFTKIELLNISNLFSYFKLCVVRIIICRYFFVLNISNVCLTKFWTNSIKYIYNLFSGLYYGVTISLVSFATGLSVVTLNIHHRGMRGREVPGFVKTIVFKYMAKIMCIRLDIPDPLGGQYTPPQPSTNTARRHVSNSLFFLFY